MALNGDVHARTKAEMLPGLEQYLSSMEFDALDELTPTQLHISDDGTTAWLIGNVRVRGRQRQDDGGMTPIAFRSAWIDLYRKIDGRWVVVARANTQGDEPGAVAPR